MKGPVKIAMETLPVSLCCVWIIIGDPWALYLFLLIGILWSCAFWQYPEQKKCLLPVIKRTLLMDDIYLFIFTFLLHITLCVCVCVCVCVCLYNIALPSLSLSLSLYLSVYLSIYLSIFLLPSVFSLIWYHYVGGISKRTLQLRNFTLTFYFENSAWI